MSEEANAAVAAGDRAPLEMGTTSEDGVQRDLILTNKWVDAVVLVPILAERVKFRDGYNKTARVSVIMLIVVCISSSYSLGAKASRGRARIFYAVA